MRLLAAGLCLSSLVACHDGIDACSAEQDITGGWAISATPPALDAGSAGLPDAFSIDAELVQGAATDLFGFGHYVTGTLMATDPSIFGTLTIPDLRHSDGSKSGAILTCKLAINVPIAMPVTDDDSDQGPLRISLLGAVIDKGTMQSVPGSTVILTSDTTNTPRAFDWTAAQTH